MMVKSGLEKIFMKCLHSQGHYLENIFYFIERRFLSQNCKLIDKNDLFCEWMDFKCFGMYAPIMNETLSQKLSIFNFEYINEASISGVLGVKLWLLLKNQECYKNHLWGAFDTSPFSRTTIIVPFWLMLTIKYRCFCPNTINII